MKRGTMWSHIVLVSLALWQIGSCISTENCPDNLENNKYLKAFGNKCYFFYLFLNKEYNDAQSVCRGKGGNLVSIKSSGMNSYLHNQLRNYYGYGGPIWIGLSDKADEKHYVWRDGSAMGYSNFKSNTGPDTPWWDITDRAQDCVAMSPWSGEWEDLDCEDNILYDHHHAFICEYNPKPKPPPATTTNSTTTLPPTIVSATTTTAPPATTTTLAPPTTTIASTTAPSTLEPIIPNEDFRTTTTPTTTKPTTTFTVPTSEAPSSTPPPPPTTTSTLPPPTTTSTLPPPTTTSPLPPPTTTSTLPPPPTSTLQPPTTTSTLPPSPTSTSTQPTTTSTSPQPPPTSTSSQPTTTEKASTTNPPTSSKDTSSVASPKETSTAAVTCPPIRCNLDCGMSGFGTNEKTGCMICKCQEE